MAILKKVIGFILQLMGLLGSLCFGFFLLMELMGSDNNRSTFIVAWSFFLGIFLLLFYTAYKLTRDDEKRTTSKKKSPDGFGAELGETELTDNKAVLSLLRDPPSTACFMPARTSTGEEIALFTIKEDSALVASLPEQVRYEVRYGLIAQSNVGLLVVMLGVGSEIYETWWNWHNPVAQQCLRNLAKQEKLVVAFFVDSCDPRRTLAVPNVFRESFARIINELSAMQPWGMTDFDNAREEVYRRYSNPQALWNVLTTQ